MGAAGRRANLLARLRSLEVEFGEEIRALGKQLGEPAEFSPLERLEAYRALRGPNVPGEPKLAKQLLAELGDSRR